MKDDKPNFPRTLISMLAFITVAVFICLWLSMNIYGDSGIDLVSKYNIDSILSTSDFPDVNTPAYFCLRSNDSRYTSFNNLRNNGINVSDLNIIDSYYTSNLNNYFWSTDAFFPCTDNSFVVVSTNSDGTALYFNVNDIDFSNSQIFRYYLSSFASNASISISNSSLKTVDGEKYILVANSNFLLLNSNLPVYTISGAVTNPITSLSDLPQINPNYNPSMSDEEKVKQHMNFDNAKIYFNVDKNFNGNVVSCLSMDDYQFEHASDYTVSCSYTCNIEYKARNQALLPWYYSKYVFNGSFERSLSSYLQSGSVGYFNLPFDEFASFSSGTYYFKGNENSDYDIISQKISMNSVIPEQLPSESLGTLSTDIQISSNEKIVNIPITINTNTCEYSAFNFSVVYTIYKDSIECGSFRCDYDVTQGNQTSTSSFRKNKEALTDVNNYNNDNNYTPGDEGYLNPSNYVNKYGVDTNNGSSNPIINTSGGNSSSSPSVNVSATGGSVNVNTSQDPSAVVSYVKNELIYDNDSTFVTKLDDFTEGNSFITLMSSTFSFLPAAFWNNVGIYFTICLGILVSFFVLRLILDLL